MKFLRAIFILIVFFSLTLPLMPLQQLFLWFWQPAARRLPFYYHRLVLKIFGIKLVVIGEIPRNQPVLIVSNHVSWLDIIILSSVAPISFIAKNEINAWPFFGNLARLQRTMFIDRTIRQTTGKENNAIANRLKTGEILALFAEGSSTDGSCVLPFKSSYFAAANDPTIVVQPLSLVYYGHHNLPMSARVRPFYAWYGDMDLLPHLWQALLMGPIEIKVICHDPTSLAAQGNRKDLAKYCEETVRQGVVTQLRVS